MTEKIGCSGDTWQISQEQEQRAQSSSMDLLLSRSLIEVLQVLQGIR